MESFNNKGRSTSTSSKDSDTTCVDKVESNWLIYKGRRAQFKIATFENWWLKFLRKKSIIRSKKLF